MIAAAVFVLGLAVAGAQNFNGGQASWYCDLLAKEDCSHLIPQPRCGTNGVTYANLCYFGRAHCADQTINQKHEGPCSPSEVQGSTTTLSPDQIIHGSQLILDFQCMALSHRPCTHTINEKICGTDGVTYEDFCEYEKSRCTHRTLHVQKLGDCTA